MRSIAEAVVAERIAQLRHELETGEIARMRAAMEAGFARLTASVETLAQAQQRTEARLEALTARVDALAEAQQRTEARLEALTARVDALAEAQQRTEARLEALAEAQRRTEARLEALAAQVQALTVQMQALAQSVGRLTSRVGNLAGQILEAEFGRKAPSYVRRVLRKAKALQPGELEDVLEPHLTAKELDDWSEADWVVVGRAPGEPADRPDVYLVVEVSGHVQVSDVVRAARRAQYLRRVGFDARGCVFGHSIDAEALDTARSMGVLVFQDGRWMDETPEQPDSG